MLSIISFILYTYKNGKDCSIVVRGFPRGITIGDAFQECGEYGVSLSVFFGTRAGSGEVYLD